MDLKAVYANLESVVLTLAADEARQLFADLEHVVGQGAVDPASQVAALHQQLGAVSEITQP